MDLTGLAEAASSALAAAMATDLWDLFKARAVYAVGGSKDDDAGVLSAELDGLRGQIMSAAPSDRADVVREVAAELRGQVRARLRNDPEFAVEFQALAEEILSRIDIKSSGNTVNQYGKSSDSSSFFQIAGDYKDGK